jgi:hypothetical protein
MQLQRQQQQQQCIATAWVLGCQGLSCLGSMMQMQQQQQAWTRGDW